MNIKEVIEYFKNYLKAVSLMGSPESQQDKVFRKAIALLERDEKFEKIFNELENCLLPEQYKIVEIIEQKYFPDEVCGNCKDYNSDTCFCAEHPEYGELVEQDTCDDWKEDE